MSKIPLRIAGDVVLATTPFVVTSEFKELMDAHGDSKGLGLASITIEILVTARHLLTKEDAAKMLRKAADEILADTFELRLS